MTDTTTQDPVAALKVAIKEKQPAGAPAAPEPAVDPAEEQARKVQEVKQMEVAQGQQDEVQIQAQLESLHELTKQTPVQPESPAPVEQAQTPIQETDQAAYKINQVGHTKIQKDA